MVWHVFENVLISFFLLRQGKGEKLSYLSHCVTVSPPYYAVAFPYCVTFGKR